jgi:hypothetical protein
VHRLMHRPLYMVKCPLVSSEGTIRKNAGEVIWGREQKAVPSVFGDNALRINVGLFQFGVLPQSHCSVFGCMPLQVAIVLTKVLHDVCVQ